MSSPALLNAERKNSTLERSVSDTEKGVLRETSGRAGGYYPGVGFDFGKINVLSGDTPDTNRTRIQPKLEINQPGDEYEREADAVAEKVMRMPHPSADYQGNSLSLISTVQRKCAHCKDEEKIRPKSGKASKLIQLKPIGSLLVQKKCAGCKEEEEQLHRKESASSATLDISPAVEQTLRSPGQSMDAATRSFMEQRFTYDFSAVRIHNDSIAHQSSKDIKSLAYTNGNHVVFGAGRYQPQVESGKKLLAHELAHVVQQTGTTAKKSSDTPKFINSSVIQRQ